MPAGRRKGPLAKRGGDDLKTVLSLIHCEWSEALEEDRNGGRVIGFQRSGVMEATPDKPIGYAVELVDGIILICSMMNRYGCKFDESDTNEFIEWVPKKWGVFPVSYIKTMRLPWLVFYLHELTSKVNANFQHGGVGGTSAALEPLRIAAGLAWIWIELHGLDPEAILIKKHEYNKHREYMHGKKY